jgi:hypothetical protein
MGSEIDAQDKLVSIEAHVARMVEAENGVEKGYARLGWMLLEVAQMQYWRVTYSTFREYLKEVSQKSKKSVGQLQQYFLTVRDLSDTFNLNELERIGISKALKVRNAKDFALVLPSEIIDAALDSNVTVRELKKVISMSLKFPEDDDSGYLDCEMEFVVTPEQRQTIETAIDVAQHTEPLTKAAISKSAQMLDVMMKFAQEFLAAHSGDGQ